MARGRPRVLIYTDSRGFDVSHWYARKNAFGSYVSTLARTYAVTAHICPHQHTTLLDFLVDCRHRIEGHHAIVLHTGIVDFSPRSAGSAERLRQRKSQHVQTLFDTRAARAFRGRSYDTRYGGAKTESLYDLTFFEEWLIPAIRALAIPVVWIGVNPVVPLWRGNYFRDRPANMNVILDYQDVIDRLLPEASLPLIWDEATVKTHTVDNVHLSAIGMDLVGFRVGEWLAARGI